MTKAKPPGTPKKVRSNKGVKSGPQDPELFAAVRDLVLEFPDMTAPELQYELRDVGMYASAPLLGDYRKRIRDTMKEARSAAALG